MNISIFILFFIKKSFWRLGDFNPWNIFQAIKSYKRYRIFRSLNINNLKRRVQKRKYGSSQIIFVWALLQEFVLRLPHRLPFFLHLNSFLNSLYLVLSSFFTDLDLFHEIIRFFQHLHQMYLNYMFIESFFNRELFPF